ncbi:MAG: chitobiase/beta-hexosaminidase C-terminal domain-containing protein [Polyangiaceae bacterium]|nr:chitobiase/beta-hexosaminidase C-terminal domain-containing protein [Polyangiaceae bacterium]
MKLKLMTTDGLKKLAVLSLAASLGVSGLVGCGGDDEGSGGSGGGKGGSGGSTGGTGGGGTGGTGGGGTGGDSGSGGGGMGGSSGSGGGGTGGIGGGGTGGTGGTVNNPCATPTFAPPAGTYTTAQSVVISTTTAGATIYYTTDGTNPNKNSVVYSAPIAVGADMTIRAMCEAPGFTDSTVGVAIYDINIDPGSVVPPNPNPAAGTQENDYLLSLTTTTPAATICFTLDGSTPVCTNGVCQGTAQTYNAQTQVPINGLITNPSTGEVTVNAIACKAGMKDGAMPAQKYTLQVATPALNGPAPGTWGYDPNNKTLMPLLSSATTGAVTARYTAPPSSAPSCTSGILVNGGANLPTNWTINSEQGNKSWSFAACKAGYKGSAVYPADYKFQLQTPTITPDGGTFYDDQSAAIDKRNTDAEGTTWTCTTSDGSTPACGTTASNCATGSTSTSINVNKTSTVLKSIACNLAFLPSEVETSDPFVMKLRPVKFTPATGTPVNSGTGNLAVTISQDGSGKSYSHICYSTTAAVPTCACTGTGLIKVPGNSASVPASAVTANTTVSAIACDDGTGGSNFQSASGSANYPSASTMAQPTITPVAGTYNNHLNVTFTNNDTSKAAKICYTLDGSDPSVNAATCASSSATTTCVPAGTVAANGGTTTINNLVQKTNVTVKAKACDPTQVKSVSSAASNAYVLKVAIPTLTTGSPAPGAVPIGSTIAWQSATTGANFYFTTDGTTPTCVGGGTTLPGSSFHMVNPASTTIKAIGCSAEMTESDVATWTYSYFLKAPTITPQNKNAQNEYNDYAIFSLENSPSDTIKNADHSYHGTNTDFFCATSDGSTPTCTATTCGFGSFAISPTVGFYYYWPGSTTMKVVACSNNGLPASAVASETFVEKVGPIVWNKAPGTYSSPENVTVAVAPAPTDVGNSYTLCWAKGSLSIPPQPNFCTASSLKTYLDAQTGGAWTCTGSLGLPWPGGGSQPQNTFPPALNTTTMMSAVACKPSMVWSTSQVNYSFNPYSHTITMDGANDFSALNDALDTGAGDVAYMSWNATNLYIGYKGFTPLNGDTVSVYFGNGVAGTTTPDGLGHPTLPKNLLYRLVWKNDTLSASIRQWTPGSPGSWGATAIPVTLGYTGGVSNDYVEFSIARAAVGSPTVVHMAGGLVNAGGTYLSVFPNPPNTNASWTQTYMFELLGAATPTGSAKN